MNLVFGLNGERITYAEVGLGSWGTLSFTLLMFYCGKKQGIV